MTHLLEKCGLKKTGLTAKSNLLSRKEIFCGNSQLRYGEGGKVSGLFCLPGFRPFHRNMDYGLWSAWPNSSPVTDLDGKEHTGTLNTDHSTRAPAILIEGVAHDRIDLLGWRVVESTEEERQELDKHGFEVTMTIDRPLPK